MWSRARARAIANEKIVEIDLNAAERAMFQKSVESVKGLIEACTKIAPHLAG